MPTGLLRIIGYAFVSDPNKISSLFLIPLVAELLAAAWHGGLPGTDSYVKQQKIRESLSLGMDYWFSRDFANPDCLDSGGTSLCPCTNPDDSLW